MPTAAELKQKLEATRAAHELREREEKEAEEAIEAEIAEAAKKEEDERKKKEAEKAERDRLEAEAKVKAAQDVAIAAMEAAAQWGCGESSGPFEGRGVVEDSREGMLELPEEGCGMRPQVVSFSFLTLNFSDKEILRPGGSCDLCTKGKRRCAMTEMESWTPKLTRGRKAEKRKRVETVKSG